MATLWDVKTTWLDGTPADLGTLRGKVALVVNVASQCGFTPQYAGLQRQLVVQAPKGFTVVGAPSNEFGGQEPGAPEEIRTFCERNYGVTFPLLSKGETKPSDSQSPVYRVLTASGDFPNWNFCKFLVGKDGKVRGFFPSNVPPDDPALRQAIADALAA